MEQKTIVISGIILSYLIENEEAQKTIFFIHGNSISSRSWKKQLQSPLLKDFRLIAFDLPGHGDSQASPIPEKDYSLPGLARIMASATNQLSGKQPYILAGISLGSNIVAEMLHFTLRPSGIVLAGSCIVGGKYTIERLVLPDTHVFVVFTEQSAEEDVRSYAAQGMLSKNENDLEEFVEDYYRVKQPFRSLLGTSLQQQNYSDQISLLKQTEHPVFIINGQDEMVIDPGYLDDAPLNLWMNRVHKIPGASHLVHIDQPEEFNLLLSRYALEVFSDDRTSDRKAD